MKVLLVCCPATVASESGSDEVGAAADTAQASLIVRDITDRFDLAAVYASSEPGALETATAIASGFGLVPIRAEALGAIARDFKSPAAANDRGTAHEGGAHLDDLQDQAWREVEEIRSETDAAGTVAVVCGPLAIRAVVCRLLGIPLAGPYRFELSPGSFSTIDFRPNRTLLAGLNETCHLEKSI